MTRRASLSALRCGAAAWALAIAMSAPAAYAQTADGQTPGADDTELETIVVTGTRIQRPEIESPIPVTAINSEQLTDRGQTDVAQFLQEVPALSFSTTTEQSTGGSTGTARLNLRGLGESRTLVLVNGRRHVAGVGGTAAVDINTIPEALLERVDVLTGGASAVYGADAVTGVVNFVLKRDFDGFKADAQLRGSDGGDGYSSNVSATFGRNFAEGRGNVTANVTYDYNQGLRFGDRSFSRDRFQALALDNPAFRFQTGEISPALIAANNALPPSQRIALHPGATIQSAIDAGLPVSSSLRDRVANATPFSFASRPSFSISSFQGRIGLGTFGLGGRNQSFYADTAFDDFVDLNNDGRPDCTTTPESLQGFGCLAFDPTTGGVRPFRDGIFASDTQQFDNPDGSGTDVNRESLVPRTERIVGNLAARYEVNQYFKPFVEAKFARSITTTFGSTGTFNDAIPILLDNPYIPADLLREVNEFLAANPSIPRSDSYVVISRDFPDLNVRPNTFRRETMRFVLGFEGEFSNGWSYDVSGNYGRTKATVIDRNARYEDRFFAAVDAVRAPNGQIVCRSDLNPTAQPPIGGFPRYTFGFRTFRPGDGSCKPMNIFGAYNYTPESLAFVVQTDVDTTVIEQTAFNANLTGDSSQLFELPGGPVRFAMGGEYRKEKSDFQPSLVNQSILPNGTVLPPENDLIFSSTRLPTVGSYEVYGGFVELNAPVLKDMPFAYVLSFDAAARIDHYNTEVGSTFTWKLGGTYAPIEDIRFRGGFNRTVRAPNIDELFRPRTTAFFGVSTNPDPCSRTNINSGPAPANRLANCRAAGAPVNFVDPRTARTRGTSSGNANLREEVSDSWTAGVVLQPRFIPNLVATVDYYNIKIEDAILAPPGREILSGCYDSPNLNNEFCPLITRGSNFGITGIAQQFVNYAAAETAGVDFDVRYRFTIGDENVITLGVGGTYVEKLDQFQSTSAPNAADPELGELDRPKWAANGSVGYKRGPFRALYNVRFEDKQFFTTIEAQDAADYTPNQSGYVWVHDISLSYQFSERFSATVGVNNLTDKEPFLGSTSSPTSALGRSFFLRGSVEF